MTPEIENKVGGDDPHRGSSLEVLRVFFKLGVSSFGGPIAHIGYFHEEFVVRRRWLSEQAFVDLIALCQFLPGPASSQTGFPIGLIRAGYGGALAAWAGFTLPSAILMVLFACGASTLSGPLGAGLANRANWRTIGPIEIGISEARRTFYWLPWFGGGLATARSGAVQAHGRVILEDQVLEVRAKGKQLWLLRRKRRADSVEDRPLG